MQKIDVEGLEIEVDLLPDGTLEVYRNGKFRGMLLVVDPDPNPEPIEMPRPELVHQSPEESAALPPGWYHNDAGHLMYGGAQDEDGNWSGGQPVHAAPGPEESSDG